MAAKISPAIKAYYDSLDDIHQRGASNEGATRIAFQNLLDEAGKPYKIKVIAEKTIEGDKKRNIRLDGILVDDLQLRRGYWEAKDTKDDLETEILKKMQAGYPLTNTLFEDTRFAVLYQEKQRKGKYDLRNQAELTQLLDQFVGYTPPQFEEYHKAVAHFKQEIPNLAASLTKNIEDTKKVNKRFVAAFNNFLDLCRKSLNPATTAEQVEDMLKQHILTERIFRSIFQNPDFVRRNAIAAELEKMVDALVSQAFSRDAFFQKTDYFYRPIEDTARTITDYSEKQALLNALYEQFFQAYSTKTADTHGIVYTPAEIVRWMVASVQKALESEFGQRLESPGVHIIDPCVGTGTFMMEILRQIPDSMLEEKYDKELHANEVQLLPYYIAAQNIEHAYFERMGHYAPFPGLCFVDTLDLTDSPQLSMFAEENTERIEAQKAAPIRVVIGNPPYNVGQENENDNNKNRKYPVIDKQIAETYAKSSKATNKNALSDPYVKFFRWATNRLGDRDGIVCYVSNNSFLEQFAFDGMRKQLLQDFTRIYTFDLGGNVRKNPKLSGTKNNVFGIQVGVSITLLIKNSAHPERQLFYTRLDEFWTNQQKLKHLETTKDFTSENWQQLAPDARYTWLTEGLAADFDSFTPIGTKEAKSGTLLEAETIFKTYGRGVATSRDDWAYDFDVEELERKIKLFIDNYNAEVARWARRGADKTLVDDFVKYDDKVIKWSESLKARLATGKYIKFDEALIRKSLYRPFCRQFLYFDRMLNERVYVFPSIFPTGGTEVENIVICVSSVGQRAPFATLVTNIIPNLSLTVIDPFQCFPFYTYAEDGTERRENITDWALEKYRAHYGDERISKWDIFHYIYAVLHAPAYRQKYAANLKRDLPRIPFVAAEAFRSYVAAGARLAELHRDYEKVKEYPLTRLENKDVTMNWRVDEKGMRLSPDKSSLRYNEWLTLANIPPRVFDYKLGNRSALDWVIDQYRVSTDARSGLHHDPNDPDEPRAIVKLVGQVIQVSLETLTLIESLPPLA